MMFYIIIGAIAVGIGGMIFAATLLFQGGNEQIEDRLAELTKNGGRGVVKQEEAATNLLKSPLDDVPNALEDFVSRFLNISKLIDQSGLDLTVTKFVAFTVGLAVVAGTACFVFSPWKSLVPIAAFVAAILPLVYVVFTRKRRLAKFDEQLPAALDLMSQALRAGQSLPAGIQLAGTQLPEPIGPEFHRAFEQQNLGVTMAQSLKDMTERIPSLDLRFFATAVILQRQTGGDLAEILDKISGLTRQRFQIKGQIQALTGEGRISGIVLLGLPPVLFLVMLYLNYDYIMLLFTDELGQKMLIAGIILQLIGAAAIKKIINIKV